MEDRWASSVCLIDDALYSFFSLVLILHLILLPTEQRFSFRTIGPAKDRGPFGGSCIYDSGMINVGGLLEASLIHRRRIKTASQKETIHEVSMFRFGSGSGGFYYL